MDEIKSIWSRIDNQLGQQFPSYLAALNLGVSGSILDAFEKAHSVAIPLELRSSYLIHDGHSDAVDGLFLGDSYISFSEVVNQWLLLSENIKLSKWSTHFIPFSRSEDYCYLCVDANSSHVINYSLEEDDFELVNDRMSVFLETFCLQLESGSVFYSNDFGFLAVDEYYRDDDLAESPIEDNSGGFSAVHKAIQSGDLSKCKSLIGSGADINISSDNSIYPIHSAVIAGDPRFISLLASGGADLEARNQFLDTPLLMAFDYQNFEIAKLLIELGADKGARNQFGKGISELASGKLNSLV